MTLDEEARQRLANVVALQPTKNAELQQQWGIESGSEVHSYLESELDDYYYRDENSLICATPEAADLVSDIVDTGDNAVTVPDLQAEILDVVADPEEDPQSVVSVLHDLRAAGRDPEVSDVRAGLRSLSEKGVLERVQKTVPTYRLAVERAALCVNRLEAATA
jgi:hypothetical protein